MSARSLMAVTAALSSALMLAGCYSSRTTEVVPPATAAAPGGCAYAGRAYTVGARVVTPEARTIECGRDGNWHSVL